MEKSREGEGYLKLDRLGRALILGPALRRRLSHRAGYYRAVESKGNMLSFSRLNEVPRQSELQEALIMQGDIEAIGSTVEVINFIHSTRLSGRFTVRVGSKQQSLVFDAGDIIAARSNLSELRLSTLIARRGLVDEESLEDARENSLVLHQPLGNYLLEAGQLSQSQLFGLFQEQVEEVFFSILGTKRGDFYLSQPLPGQSKTPLRLSTQQMLLEGLKRVDELERIREVLPNEQVHVAAKGRALSEGARSPLTETLWPLIAKPTPIATLEAQLPGTRFELLTALFSLYESGSLEISSHGEQGPQISVEKLIELYNDAFELIAIFGRERGEEDPLNHGLSLFLQSSRLDQLFEGLRFDSAGHLGQAALGEKLKGEPIQRQLQSCAIALSELLYFQLFVARTWLEEEQRERVEAIFDELNRLSSEAIGEVF